MPLIFLLVFLFSIAIAPAAFALEGNGTGDDPYLIATQQDLEYFRSIVNNGTKTGAYAKLTADIELPKSNWTPIGDESNEYTGTFDGGGHAISGLSVNGTSDCVGFFGYVGLEGTVKNLTIVGGSVSGEGDSVGGIVGYNDGTVENCANSANVSSEGDSVGGIVGYNTGTVKNCANSANVSGSYYVGGIVGSNTWTVQNCTNSAAVSGSNYIGGIVGWNSSTVQNCGYLSNDDVNSGINAIGGSTSGTNVVSFSSKDEMAQIAVTLSASIADSATAANGETTITLTTQPGTASTVMSAGGLEISASDSKGLVTVTNNNNDGTLTVRANGNGIGETVITVEVELYTYNYVNNEYTDSTTSTYEFNFDLTVNDVEIEGIALSDLEMAVGESHTLTVSYTPDNTTQRGLTWTSSDESVATVSNGVVTAKAEGTATITATSAENTSIYDTCTMTVSAATPEPTVPESEEPEDEPVSETKSSGGGCSAGTGALSLLALIPLAMRRKR